MTLAAAVVAGGNTSGGRGGYQRKLRGKRTEAGEGRGPPGGKRRQLQMGVEDMASTGGRRRIRRLLISRMSLVGATVGSVHGLGRDGIV